MISFIIPTLNEESTLKETLELLKEYQGPHEIIISDGGSTDSTVAIAKSITEKVFVHSAPHRQTIAEGRNLGALHAQGTYIVEMDADTHFPDINTFFSKMISLFENNPTIVGATTWFRVYPKDETFMDRLVYGITGMGAYLMNTYLGASTASGGEFQMVRTDAFKKIGGYDDTIVVMEDNEMFARLGKLGKIHFEKDLCIYHSGRRAHIVGWPKLIGGFIVNLLSLPFLKKAATKEWKPVR